MSQTKAQLVQPVGVFTGTGINVTGVITATSFVGSGEGLTGVASTDNIITGTAATFNNTVQVNSTLTANSGFTTNAINTNLNVTGVTTIATVTATSLTATSLTAATGVTTNTTNTNLNVTGVGTFAGSLTAATGNIGNLNITKSAAGAGSTVGSFTGVTTYYGDGSGLTGVGESLAPHYYDPGVHEEANIDTGIGITFNKKILAGSGTATLKICNAGVAGTTVQSWGISSATIGVTDITLGALVSNLQNNSIYQLDIPEGFVVSSTGTNYVGTAYTFDTSEKIEALMGWGAGGSGQLDNSSRTNRSSPTQIPGRLWTGGKVVATAYNGENATFIKSDGTLWTWGNNSYGSLGQNDTNKRSSPVQIPGTTWKVQTEHGSERAKAFIKTDGTLWVWGHNEYGQLGLNSAGSPGPGADNNSYSSPVQVPGTTWSKASTGRHGTAAIKTDGTLWSWGYNGFGCLGHGNTTHYSSPVQVPGTTWRSVDKAGGYAVTTATKTDGTLWCWGVNNTGQLGQNSRTDYSSPKQIPGTSWVESQHSGYLLMATKTDNTLWTLGYNPNGSVGNGTNSPGYSSPVQVTGSWETSKDKFGTSTYGGNSSGSAIKTDGTLWSWGYQSERGELGVNDRSARNSPVQVGQLTDWVSVRSMRTGYMGLYTDYTP